VAKAKSKAKAKTKVKAKAKAKVKAIPKGQQSLTPHLVVRGASQAIEFYKEAFGAKEVGRMPTPDGKHLMHANLKFGDTNLYLVDAMPHMGGPSAPHGGGPVSVSLHLYVDDVDKAFKKAVAAGAKPGMPPMDMFWGDRYAKVTDPFGHEWSIATHMEDVSPKDMKNRGEAAFAAMAQGKT
jgi:PhnB protein